MSYKILAILILVYLSDQQNPDLVTDIPIQGYQNDWYSGYLQIGSNKSFHYIFFPSLSGLSTDPLVVNLGGGMGCSSLYEMMYGNGPFKFNKLDPQQFIINNHTWNTNANLLFIQSPTGVGFNIGNIQNNTDQSITFDHLLSLRVFYSKYPVFKPNDIYLTGEHYSGVYVPLLANKIIQVNKEGGQQLNLKGILVGNPCTTSKQCYLTQTYHQLSLWQVRYFYKIGFINQTQYKQFRSYCELGYGSDICLSFLDIIKTKFISLKVNPSNVYAQCTNQVINNVTVCNDQIGIINFLNSDAIKSGLHVNTNIQFKICNKNVQAAYNKSQTQSYHTYKKLMNKIRVWVYSGDVNGVVPITGTKDWIRQLREQQDIPIITPWREWWTRGKYPHQDQVGGFVWHLRGINFVTVREAGLITAYWAPYRMKTVFDNFIANKNLPYN